ncbi:MAG: hypothetical protein J0M07_04910 [Anaerolineae bacterium]|nr:hypothetical protein [Anaerolineae bacterium]
MLRLLFRLSLLIFALAAVVIALAPLAAPRPVAASPAWAAYGFAACDLPCWAGITVGETPFGATVPITAQNIPRRIAYTIAGSSVFLWEDVDPYYFTGLLSAAGVETVGRIQLTVSLPADYLLERLGLPACVFSVRDFNGLSYTSTIYWSGADWVVEASVSSPARSLFTPGATIKAVVLFSGTMQPCPKTTAPWIGAAAWWRYTAWIEEQAD